MPNCIHTDLEHARYQGLNCQGLALSAVKRSFMKGMLSDYPPLQNKTYFLGLFWMLLRPLTINKLQHRRSHDQGSPTSRIPSMRRYSPAVLIRNIRLTSTFRPYIRGPGPHGVSDRRCITMTDLEFS